MRCGFLGSSKIAFRAGLAVSALLASQAVPSVAVAAGSYDMRAMMAQPYPFSLQRAATMFQRPSQQVAPAPAPSPTIQATTLPPGSIDPYMPATALISRGGGTSYRPATVPVTVSATGPNATPISYTAAESANGSGDFWRDGIWRIEGQNEDRGPLEGAMGTSHSGHLTWGWRVSYTPDEENPEWFRDLRNWVGWPGGDWRAKVSYGVEQIAYSPNTRQRDNELIDRPYSGVLLGTSRINLTKPFNGGFQQSDTLELGLGIAGEGSGASVVHRAVHSVLGKSSRSFKDQIKTEPVFLIQYEKGLRAVYEWNKWLNFELNPYVGAAVGNLFTYASVGTIVRMGSHLKRDAGASRTRYLMTGETFPDKGKYWVWNLFAGAEQRAVGFNITVDGNTYTDTSDVSSKPLVYDLVTGGELGYGPYRFSVTHVYRSEEFKEQTGQDRFVRAAFSAKF